MTSTLEPRAEKFHHEALMYAGDEGFRAGTLPFIREGIAAREPVMVALAADRIRELTRALGSDAKAVRFVDIRQIGYNPARIIPAWVDWVEAVSPDGRPVRGIGEPVWAGRSSDELVECERHEALLNLVLEKHSQLRLLCPYDVDQLDPLALEVGRRTHPLVLQGGQSLNSELYPGTGHISQLHQVPLPAPPAGRIELEFGAGQGPEVRQVVARCAVSAELPTMRRADLEWAVTELLTNSIRHGGGRGTIRVWEDSAGIVCEVQDRGRLDDPLVGRYRPKFPGAEVRGLWLVNQICNLVQVRSSEVGTVVRIHVSRAEGPREVGGVPLLSDQLLTALDRFAREVERRLSQSDRSLLWRLTPGAESFLMRLPDGGVRRTDLPRLLATDSSGVQELQTELEALGLLHQRAEADAVVRLLPTAKAGRLREAVTAARRAVLERMVSRLPAATLAEVESALGGWAAR
ncbi:MAG: sensor histidine kinase [Candidatus Dormiibacterota bacterium]